MFRSPTPQRRLRRIAAAASTAALVSAAVPALAGADSISYVKDGNVWLATPDGSRTFQVTSDGGYTYASQSDDGSVIVASKDRQLLVLTRTGELVRKVPTVVGSSSWFGPFEPQVSPDGAHIAYQYYFNGSGSTTTGTAYANTDGTPGGYDLHTGWGYPAWIDNATLLESDPPNALSQDVIVRGLNQPNNEGTQWFHQPEAPQLRDGDVRGNRLAFVGGENAEYLLVYRYTGAAGSELPTYCYHHNEPTGKFEGPAFSPDGAALAWGEADGIHTGPVGDLSAKCNIPDSEGGLAIAGARFPDWSGADVPAPRDTGTPPGGNPPGGNPPGGNPPGGNPPGGGKPGGTATKPRLTITRAKLATVLKKGLVVRVRNGKGRVALTATISAATARKAGLGRKAIKVASGTATAKSGAATVRLRFTKTAAKRLAKLRSVSLIVRGGGAATTTIALKR